MLLVLGISVIKQRIVQYLACPNHSYKYYDCILVVEQAVRIRFRKCDDPCRGQNQNQQLQAVSYQMRSI
jgi:hypothetical protein